MQSSRGLVPDSGTSFSPSNSAVRPTTDPIVSVPFILLELDPLTHRFGYVDLAPNVGRRGHQSIAGLRLSGSYDAQRVRLTLGGNLESCCFAPRLPRCKHGTCDGPDPAGSIVQQFLQGADHRVRIHVFHRHSVSCASCSDELRNIGLRRPKLPGQ